VRFALSLLLAALAFGPVAAGQGEPPVPIADLVDAYGRGDYDTVSQSLARERDLAQFAERFMAETQVLLIGQGEGFDRRPLIAAAIALEAAAAHGYRSPYRSALLLLTAGALVRTQAPTRPEQLWHLGALAILGGLADGPRMGEHAARALERFPLEPAFVMAAAVAAELRTYPDDREGPSLARRDPDVYAAVCGLLERARAHAGLRAEASMRLGSVRLRGSEVERAIEHLREAVSLADHPRFVYLSNLLLGRALQASGQADEAIAAYRAATEAVPGAQTAELALAAALIRRGRAPEATRLVEASVANRPRPQDPWLTYGQGDLWRLPEFLSELRRSLR